MVTPHKLDEKGPLRRLNRAINSVNELAQSMRIQRGLGYSVRHTAHGQVIQLEDRTRVVAGEAASPLQRFQATEIQNDYVSARKLNSDGTLSTDTTVYKIAKPKELRVATQTGANIFTWGDTFVVSFPFPTAYGNSRRLTSGTRYVDEVLLPSYVVGSEIYATEATGETGVTVSGTRLTWIDVNADARQYRPKYTKVAVCVTENGQTVTKYMYVAGGPVQA